MAEFRLPEFFNYPPYFTLQPVRETRQKQVQLWKESILNYCKHHKIYIINIEEEIPLFSNPSINSRGEWLDKEHKRCLILWRRIQDWAEYILQFVHQNGLENGVITLEEIQSGVESRGTDLAGIDRLILVRALKRLEQRGKAVLFKGSATDDEGVKFSV